jgi:hypothetical protein
MQAGMIRSSGEVSTRRRRPRWRHRLALSLVVGLLAVFVALSCALFVWPPSGRPQHVNGILSMNGPNEKLREQRALTLVREGYAPVLLFSEGHYPKVPCPRVRGVRVVCFIPKPARTVGEVDFADTYAAQHGWRSIMIVSGHTQATRARLLAARCFRGRAVVVPAASEPLFKLMYGVVYEWGATMKALVVDPGCARREVGRHS